MKQIGITVYSQPEKPMEAQLQYQIFDANGTIESGHIVQSRVFTLQSEHTIQFREVIKSVVP